MELRNWIEKATNKRLGWKPMYWGKKGHRDVYTLEFEDYTEAKYYIDFENEELEQITPLIYRR